MKQTGIAQAGILALALVFGITMIACGGKAQAQAQTQTGGGGSGTSAAADLQQAGDTVKGTVKDAAGAAVSAVKGAAGSGKPAEATDFVYSLNKAKNGVIISGIQKDAKFGAHLVVPAEIEGFPVVGYLVGYDPYGSNGDGHSDASAKKRNQPPLESVVFPDSITFMGQSGEYELDERYGIYNHEDYDYPGKFSRRYCEFTGCASLKSIVLPKNLKIAPRLRDLPSLKAEGITWPEALEVIKGFGDDTTTEVIIPNGVKFITESAFGSMKKLTTVTIPDSVEKIYSMAGSGGAFSDCPELTTVNLPAHPITYDGDPPDVFLNCPKLGIAAQKAIKDSGYTNGRFRY